MGRTLQTRRATAAKIRKAFESVDFIVDVDDSYGKPSDRLRFSIDQEALEFHGVEEQAVYDTIGALVGGVKVGFSQRGGGTKPIDISVKFPKGAHDARRAAALELLSLRAGPCGRARMSSLATWSRSRANAHPIRSSVTTAASPKW